MPDRINDGDKAGRDSFCYVAGEKGGGRGSYKLPEDNSSCKRAEIGSIFSDKKNLFVIHKEREGDESGYPQSRRKLRQQISSKSLMGTKVSGYAP